MFARKIICKSCFRTECTSFCELKWFHEISQVTWPEAKKKLAKDEKENVLSWSCILLQRIACHTTCLQFQVADLCACLMFVGLFIWIMVRLLSDFHSHLQGQCHWMRAMRFLCVCFLICKTELIDILPELIDARWLAKTVVYNKNSKTLDIFCYYSNFLNVILFWMPSSATLSESLRSLYITIIITQELHSFTCSFIQWFMHSGMNNYWEPTKSQILFNPVHWRAKLKFLSLIPSWLLLSHLCLPQDCFSLRAIETKSVL